jgi:hypothetical protein
MKLLPVRIAAAAAGVIGLGLVAAPGASARVHASAANGTQIVCASPHVTVIATHRTKTSAWREERVTEPTCHRASSYNARSTAHARLARSPEQGECNTYESIGLRDNNKQIFARAWLANCIGESACSKYATLQQKEDSPQQGDWEDVKSGNNAGGCTEADYAWVDGTCYTEPTIVFSYRPRGVFTIVWDDGTKSTPVEYGATIGGYKLACG